MRIYQYLNYNEYVKAQKDGFEKKNSNQWAIEENIKFLSEYLFWKLLPKRGICHGTRSGLEQRWFMKYLKECYVIGTEIGTIHDILTVQ